MRQVLLNQMELKNINKSELAKKVGCSNGLLTKFFTQQKPIDFEVVLNIIRYLLPEKETELIMQYCSEISKPDHFKTAFEYLSTNRMLDALKSLLFKAQSIKNHELQEWIQVYNVMHDWQLNNTPSNRNKMLEDIEKLNTNNQLLKPLITIMESYYYFYIHEYKVMKIFADKALNVLNNLKNDYLKKSFRARIDQMMAYVQLKVNCDEEKARKHSGKLIEANVGQPYTAFGYYIIGLSYFYNDVDQCQRHLEQSIKIYKEIGQVNHVQAIQNKLNLALNYWNVSKTTDGKYDKVKQAIAVNDSDSLNEIYSDNLESPEYLYFKGLMDNNFETLMMSLVGYVDQSDNFFANLPKQALKSLGYSEKMLDKVVAINKVS